jgi:uncharacterized protein
MNREVMTSEPGNEPISHSVQMPEMLEPVIRMIRQSLPAEKIFLLGSYPANPKTLGVEFDLMVLLDSGDKRPMHEYESLIANRSQDLAMISVSVFQIRIVNQLLVVGNPFFSHICDLRKIIFDGGRLQLVDKQPVVHRLDVDQLTGEFAMLFSRAKAFLCGAISYRVTKDFQLAAFMVHQTVEQTLNAFLSPLMGYRLQTHNLNKLFLYARRFSIRFYEIYPKDTDQEIQLYQTLHKAYIYGRYKDNFRVSEEVLQMLITRAEQLLQLTEYIFYRAIEYMHSGKPILL